MKDNSDKLIPNREMFQMMDLAECLGFKSKCEGCQRLIQDHTFLELQVCLQEVSKRDAKHTAEVLKQADQDSGCACSVDDSYCNCYGA